MLKTTQLVHNTSVDRLVKLWAGCSLTDWIMTGVKVKWVIIELWNKGFAVESLAPVVAAQIHLWLAYIQELHQAFSNKRKRFEGTVSYSPSSRALISVSVFKSSSNFYFPVANSCGQYLNCVAPIL